MTEEQTKIVELLKGLEDMEGKDRIKVDIAEGGGTIWISHPNEYQNSIYVKLTWIYDHYIGYFTDYEGTNLKNAQISLWSLVDAGYFAAACPLLLRVRARRLNPDSPVD